MRIWNRAKRIGSPWPLLAALLGAGLALVLPGCVVATPLKVTPAWRALDRDGPDLVLALTYAQLDSRTRDAFDRETTRMFEQLDATDGLLAYSRRKRLFGDEVWTLTLWRDEAAHDAFVAGASHRRARKAGRPALVRTKFALLPRSRAAGLPAWDDVLGALERSPPREHSVAPHADAVGFGR